MERLPIVGVMGSGAQAWTERAAPLGRLIAHLGAHLLTGGGGGVMDAVSRAFAECGGRRGLVIGVLPGGADGRAKPGYPNRWVEIAIATHLPLSGKEGEQALSRNPINILSADAVVALPGGAGTLSEVRLALRYRKPIFAFVASVEELPGLPPEVPTSDRIEAVQEFLRVCLAGKIKEAVLRQP